MIDLNTIARWRLEQFCKSKIVVEEILDSDEAREMLIEAVERAVDDLWDMICEQKERDPETAEQQAQWGMVKRGV